MATPADHVQKGQSDPEQRDLIEVDLHLFVIVSYSYSPPIRLFIWCLRYKVGSLVLKCGVKPGFAVPSRLHEGHGGVNRWPSLQSADNKDLTSV